MARKSTKKIEEVKEVMQEVKVVEEPSDFRCTHQHLIQDKGVITCATCGFEVKNG